MKLPILHSGSGGGNSIHSYNELIDQDENDLDNLDDLNSENTEVDFTEYMWMENEEEFDKLEWQRLEEEALIKECMENMQDEVYDENPENEHIFLWQINCE